MTQAARKTSEPNMLIESGLPLAFAVSNAAALGFAPPPDRLGQAYRSYIRSLTVMQKEALVVSTNGDAAWRLASDEGPYLDGNDVAPPPLGFLTAGMVASYMSEFLALAAREDVTVRDIELVQDNYYTMEGSALRGTMIGGALPIDLELKVDADADEGALKAMMLNAVAASPLNGLMRGEHASLFTLTKNGEAVAPDRVAAIDRAAEPDLGDRFDGLALVEGEIAADEFVRKLAATEVKHGVAGGAGTSLAEHQDRKLHARGICTLREDGVKEIEQHLFSPLGSTFRFLSDELPRFGGKGRAPDACTLISAGIGFCFMTQVGRYAKIARKDLPEYRIAQDTHFSLGGATGGTGKAGAADPVETHLYIKSKEDDAFARTLLDMGEQTCFLHAFCRTELKAKVRVTRL